MADLSERQARAVYMCRQGMTTKEIAREFRCTESAVCSLLRMAEEKLGYRLRRRGPGNLPGGKGHGRATCTAETMDKTKRIDEGLARQPVCRRCGLRGAHDCLQGNAIERRGDWP